MRSAALFGASLLVTLATACGDDGGNNNGSCGDGHTTGSEQCDDGNTTSGDGCSATCQNESSGPKCGDNNVDVATEQCDDGNTTSGDGCSATCQNETSNMCGNGAINGSEACDDGDTMGGDGCSATCTVETGYTCTGTPSVCTMTQGATGTCAMPTTLTFTGTTELVATGTGDTTTSTTDQVPKAECGGYDAGDAHDQIWKFTTTAVQDVRVTVAPMGTTFDPVIRVLRAPCDQTMEIIDAGGEDGCGDDGVEEESEVLSYSALAAGTYYVVVDGYDMTVGGYTITVNANPPACGNGQHEAGEECDDNGTTAGDGCSATCEVETGYACRTPQGGGPSVCKPIACGNGYIDGTDVCDDGGTTPGDGCSATCTVEPGFVCTTGEPSFCAAPGCGNGVLETATEECDDKNVVSGDRCSATCTMESDVLEAEPNDTTAQVLTAGSHIIRGSFIDDDVDLYSFTLTQPSNVVIETYDSMDSVANYQGRGANMNLDCRLNDTVMGVFDSTGDLMDFATAIAADDDDGQFACSYMGPNDSTDTTPVEMGASATQLVNLPAGTYTIEMFDYDALAVSRYLIDLQITPVTSAAVPPAAGDLVINEFLPADGGAMNGGVDSNCDTNLTQTDDEFIELLNVSNKMLDLTGVTISDSTMVQFTFGAATNLGTGSLTLAPGKAVTIWAGGAPQCAGVTNWFTPVATQHTLSMNDTGDTMTVKTGGATPVTIATVTYVTADVVIGTSRNLSPDGTGTTYALHSAVAGAVGNISPGKKANGTAY